jgi:hypothetical protein
VSHGFSTTYGIANAREPNTSRRAQSMVDPLESSHACASAREDILLGGLAVQCARTGIACYASADSTLITNPIIAATKKNE